MRLRQLLSIAFVVVLFVSICQAYPVQLAFTGASNFITKGFYGPADAGPRLALDTNSWTQSVQAGSTSAPVPMLTVRYLPPSDLQAYWNWAETNITEGVLDSGDGFGFVPYPIWYCRGGCYYISRGDFEFWRAYDLGSITLDGELPSIEHSGFSSSPNFYLGNIFGDIALGSIATSPVQAWYYAYYPEHNLWLNVSLAQHGWDWSSLYTGSNCYDEYEYSGLTCSHFVLGDSSYPQSETFYLTFDVRDSPIPEPNTALLFAGIVPVFLYRRLRRRRE